MRFTPGIPSTIVTIIILPVLLSLSIWQYQRGNSKEFTIKSANVQSLTKQINVTDINMKLIKFQPVTITGNLEERSFLLDNRVLNGKTAYEVLVPIKITNGYVLINRGLVAVANRKIIPNIPHIKTTINLTGIVYAPSSGIQLSNNNLEKLTDNTYRIQKLDFTAIKRHVPGRLADFVIKLDNNQDLSFTQLPIYFGMSASKHFAYALQWLAMALVVVIYYVVINVKRGNATEK